MADNPTLEQIRARRAELEAELQAQPSSPNTAMRDLAFANGGSVTIETIRRRRAALQSELRAIEPRPARSPGYQRAMEREQRIGQVARQGPMREARDWTNNILPDFRDELAGAAAYITQGGENILRGALNRPIEIQAGESGQAAMDYTRQQTREYQREHPIAAGAAGVAGALAAGRPSGEIPQMSALRAAGVSAAMNLPFSIARREGSLQERVVSPNTAIETGIGALAGAGGQALSNVLNRNAISAATRAADGGAETVAQRASRFERAGVRPTTAAILGGESGGLTKMIGENWLAGGRVRGALRSSIDDTATAAGNLTQRAGEATTPLAAGETAQQGIQRFARGSDIPNPTGADPNLIPARDWSFAAKANALYQRVFARLDADEAAYVAGRAGPSVDVSSTTRALDDIMASISGPESARVMQSPQIARIQAAIEADAEKGALRFGDLRRWRTWVREAQRDDGLRQGIANADLQRLEAALTDDIYRSAAAIGGDAARQLRRVDQFYRAGMQRINRALEPFARGSGEGAYARILTMAQDRSGGNARALMALKQSLQPDEWRQVSATLLSRMGEPTAGTAGVLDDGAFSVARFATNYSNMSERARSILFGPLADELDNLARVADMQRGVERMANHSRSGVSVQNVGTIGGLVTPSTTAPTVGLLVTMGVTGEMLTNPMFVRWLTSAAAPGQTLGGLSRQLSALGALAARDPALAPFYAELVRRVGDHFPRQESQSAASPQASQRTQSPASLEMTP